MSYDLSAFEPAAAPKTRRNFLRWYEQQTEWGKDHGRDDPSVATPALRAVYAGLVDVFPSMDEDLPYHIRVPAKAENRLAAYSVGDYVLAASFAEEWAERAQELMEQLCREHGAGCFEVSEENGRILLPDGTELL